MEKDYTPDFIYNNCRSYPSTCDVCTNTVYSSLLTDNKQDILHLSHYKPFLSEDYYNKNKKLHCTANTSDILQYIEKIINNR